MLSNLVVKKGGQIFVNSACGDTKNCVMRRAARIALRDQIKVNFEIINTEPRKYEPMTTEMAKDIMTPNAWIQELRDPFAGRFKRKDWRLISPNAQKRILAELKRERREMHLECLRMDAEISTVEKMFRV